MEKYYVIKEVKPRHGSLRWIHAEVLDRRCYIVEIEVGQRGWIKYEPQDEPGNFHRLHTSTIQEVNYDEAQDRYEIVTMNTVYILEPFVEK